MAKVTPQRDELRAKLSLSFLAIIYQCPYARP
jgi:hypothetical protein